MTDSFHAGERAIQELTGERNKALLNGQVIADTVPAGAIRFVAEQETAVVGNFESAGDLWAGLIAGPKGFARVRDNRRQVEIAVDNTTAWSTPPPFIANLIQGSPLGVLFIELATRRRLRVNGRITERDPHGLTLAVEQAYPNCPKYIQRRIIEQQEISLDATGGVMEGTALTDALHSWLGAADTFFVASASPDGAVDVSHRGGSPGFVRLEHGALWIPDYPGNSMFNTFGNFYLNPRAGLCVPDFDGNRQLQLTGDVSLELSAGESAGETGGTGRWWRFVPRRWMIAPLNRPLAWKFIDASPFNPPGPNA